MDYPTVAGKAGTMLPGGSGVSFDRYAIHAATLVGLKSILRPGLADGLTDAHVRVGGGLPVAWLWEHDGLVCTWIGGEATDVEVDACLREHAAPALGASPRSD